MKLTNQAHLLTWFFLKFAVIDVATTALINWKFVQHIIQNSKIFFSLLYTELIKNSFFDNTRPVLGLRIWHQKKKEKYPKSKYMLYIQIPKTITNCQIIIPKFSSHEDSSILKIYWAQNAYLHLSTYTYHLVNTVFVSREN